MPLAPSKMVATHKITFIIIICFVTGGINALHRLWLFIITNKSD